MAKAAPWANTDAHARKRGEQTGLDTQTPTGGSSGEFWTMGETLIQPFRVSEEGLRVVKLFQQERNGAG